MKSVIFARPKHWNPLSWLIQKITKSEASHVLIGTEISGIPVVLHAAIGGVKFSHRAKYLSSHAVVAEFQIPEDVNLSQAVDLLDEAYDYKALIGHLIRQLVHIFYHTWIKNPLYSSKSFVCSEFVLKLKLPPFIDSTPEETTPNDLLQKARLNPDYFKRL